MNTYKLGDKIKVLLFGVTRCGTVSRNQNSSIVWVRFDGEARERWFHAESVTRLMVQS